MATTKDKEKAHAHEERHQDEDVLIVMVKGADEIAVHPTCVKSHVAAGWAVKG